MSTIAVTCVRINCRLSYSRITNGFHTCTTLLQNERWRVKHGLAVNPNTCGPLTDYPDYSYKDGRPTPYGVRQFTRMEKQRQYAKRIVQLVGEVDHAVERYDALQKKKQEEREQILANKLKPKGDHLYEEESDKKQ